MNEGRTTAIFVIVTVVALGLAWWSRPKPITSEDEIAQSLQGTDVFPDFSDPESASSLQIAQYDEELAQLERFEVARDPRSNLWTLPSHDDYPADAAEQVKDATTPLIGLQILSVETDLRSDHEMYGVVNPDDEELAAGASGVGMLVTLKDDKDVLLASLIIGKEVEGVEGQRYVRKPDQDAVYKVELDANAFSTDFRDWIEGELLDVRSFDITRIAVRDYDLQQSSLTTMALSRNFDAEVKYESSEGEWSLVSYQTYEGGAAQPADLAEGESLNTEYLNSMRTAAQDLEIIDVKRKPTGLAADLKADESLLQDEQSVSSLQAQGFYPAGGPEGTEIYAASGETILGTDDGVRYVLRFGEVTANLSSLSESPDEESGLSRYLLVTTRLDESMFPFPELEEAPATVEEMLARENNDPSDDSQVDEAETADDAAEPTSEQSVDAAGEVDDEVDADQSDSDTSDAEQTQSSDTTEELSEESSEEAEDTESESPIDAGNGEEETPSAESSGPGDNQQSDGSEASEAGTDENETAAEAPEAVQDENAESDPEQAPADSGDQDQASENVKADSESSDASSEAEAEAQEGEEATDEQSAAAEEEQEAPTTEETPEELAERLEAVREEIAKENQRKIDERNEKLEEARKRVQELNARFSEWYYVVSDSEYNKLKLTQDNLITTESDADAESATPNLSEGLDLPGGQLSFPPQP